MGFLYTYIYEGEEHYRRGGCHPLSLALSHLGARELNEERGLRRMTCFTVAFIVEFMSDGNVPVAQLDRAAAF